MFGCLMMKGKINCGVFRRERAGKEFGNEVTKPVLAGLGVKAARARLRVSIDKGQEHASRKLSFVYLVGFLLRRNISFLNDK